MLLTLTSFIAEISGLNPTEGMDVRLMFVMGSVSMPL
jgi:hypothetical protein